MPSLRPAARGEGKAGAVANMQGRTLVKTDSIRDYDPVFCNSLRT